MQKAPDEWPDVETLIDNHYRSMLKREIDLKGSEMAIQEISLFFLRWRCLCPWTDVFLQVFALKACIRHSACPFKKGSFCFSPETGKRLRSVAQGWPFAYLFW